MSDFQFVCLQHQHWISDHPEEAFKKAEHMRSFAEHLLVDGQLDRAIPYIGTALETTEIIFNCRLESPQLTTMLTSLSIMLANTYYKLNQQTRARQILQRNRQKMMCAIRCGDDYASKVAFYRHCANALESAHLELELDVDNGNESRRQVFH